MVLELFHPEQVKPPLCHPERAKRVEGSPEPAAGSDLWPRPEWKDGWGPANRPLAGDGASRRPQGVCKSENVPCSSLSGFRGSFDSALRASLRMTRRGASG